LLLLGGNIEIRFVAIIEEIRKIKEGAEALKQMEKI
jgi:hypothetical protein